MEEINEVKQLQGVDLNKAKAILAYEATKICHSEDEALKAFSSSVSRFGAVEIPASLIPSSTIPRDISRDGTIKVALGRHAEFHIEDSTPSSQFEAAKIFDKLTLTDLLVEVKLCTSKSNARRLIQQGGAYINDIRVSDFEYVITKEDLKDNTILLRAGKKKYHRLVIAGHE